MAQWSGTEHIPSRDIIEPQPTISHIGSKEEQSYQYEPLGQNGQQIRTLRLLPGEGRDAIRVKISTRDLAAGIPYEALSYVWGDPSDLATIIVQGRQKQILDVTRNLHEALLHLRHRIKPRSMWVDAVCINQANVEERGQQVAMMREIYSRAAKVIVWLGPEAGGSTRAMRLLKVISDHVFYDNFNGLKALTHDRSWSDPEAPLPFDGITEDIIYLLFRRPWFTRLWVWQEVLSAGDNCVVACGSD